MVNRNAFFKVIAALTAMVLAPSRTGGMAPVRKELLPRWLSVLCNALNSRKDVRVVLSAPNVFEAYLAHLPPNMKYASKEMTSEGLRSLILCNCPLVPYGKIPQGMVVFLDDVAALQWKMAGFSEKVACEFVDSQPSIHLEVPR